MQNETCGIYLITEKATGKMYVGLSRGAGGIEGRWVKHKSRFPEALFSYEILLPCPPETTREELSLLEKFYIRELDCMEPKGFNKTSGGCGKTEMSEASKKRRSEKMKGRSKSEEARAKQSAAQKGRVRGSLSEEHKQKLSKILKGRIQSEEWKSKGAVARKGKSLSEEHRANLSASLKGRSKSEEARAKNSATQKGRVKGPMSEEQKMKISEAVKARLALKRAAEAAAAAALEALLFTETETETISSPE